MGAIVWQAVKIALFQIKASFVFRAFPYALSFKQEKKSFVGGTG